MPAAQKADDATCPRCGETDEVWKFTKAGETTERLECDGCGNEWSRPGDAR